MKAAQSAEKTRGSQAAHILPKEWIEQWPIANGSRGGDSHILRR